MKRLEHRYHELYGRCIICTLLWKDSTVYDLIALILFIITLQNVLSMRSFHRAEIEKPLKRKRENFDLALAAASRV